MVHLYIHIVVKGVWQHEYLVVSNIIGYTYVLKIMLKG
jgi:hypothetical protein